MIYSILKMAGKTGLTLTDLRKKARASGVKNHARELKALIDAGFVLLDKSTNPTRVRAITQKATGVKINQK